MSQVIRKFENSGKIEQSKPELFERSGVGKYNKADLVAGLYRNIDTYIKNNNLSGDKAVSFRNSANQFIKGIENGTISMNGDGTFSDATGSMASTGKFDKNWTGRKKDTTNNAVNLVGDYALDYINQMQQYTEPAAKPKSKFNTNDFLTKEISKRWYGGNDIDFGNWFKNRSEQDRNALLGEIFNNADYNQLYNDYDWTDTGINSAEDLANRGRAFSTAISNNTLDNDDYNTFATLGGSGLDKFLKEAPVQTEPTPEQSKMKAWEAEAKAAGATTPEAISAFIKGKQQDEENTNRAIIERQVKRDREIERDTFFNDYATKNPFRETIQSGYAPSSLSYKPEDYDKPIKDFYNNNIDQYLNDNLSRDWFKAGNGQHIANHMDYIINHLGMTLPDAGDGFVAIPSTFDYNNYTTMVYNPTTRQYKEVSMLVNDALRRLANTHYDSTHTPKKKDGGVLYMQFGGTYSAGANYSRYQQKRELEKKTKDEEASKQRAESSGRTVEEQKVADRKPGSITSGNWTGEDYTRLASIVADIGSMGTAYIPVYGTAASAILGAGSSVASYGADLSENGFRWGDLGNLAVNLGLDTVGLVPGLGSAAKGSKILKTAAKYLPRVLATVSLANTPEIYRSVKKAMTPGTDLTVDDWRNIAEGFKMVLQGGKGIKRTVQAHNLKKELATGNSLLTTLGGKEVSVTPAQLSEIRSHRKLEDQEAALQLLLKDDNLKLAGDLNKRWFNPTGWFPNSNIRKEYDFNKTKKVRTSKGEIEVPIVHSNSDKYIAAAMQQNFIKIPGVDELAIKYNDWKYGVNKGNKKPTKNQKTPKPKKKKTSRDDRVTKKAEGGIVQFLQDGKTVGRIKAKDMSGWNRAQALANYDWIADYDRWASQHNSSDDVVDSYITAFNGGEDIYDKLTESTGNYFGGKYNYSVQDPLAKQRQITFRGTNQGFDDLIRNGIIGYGTTEGKTGFDVYSGDRTGNRTLGRGLSTADVARFNEQLATRGMELYDNGKGGYRLRRLQEPVINMPEVEVVADKKTTQPTTPSSTITPGVGKTKKPFNFNVMPEDVIALGRMVGGLAANNKAAKLYKEGLKPTLLDTFENTVPLQGNFQAVTNAEQQAGNLESVAARPRTSDASLQLAGELEASDKAGQARFQGGLQDAEMFYKTRMLGQQESDAAKARRVNVANRNRASMNQIDAAKKQIDAARVTSNYQQVIAPFLAGVENQFAKKRAMNQQLDMESAQKEAERLYSPEFDRLTDDYNTAYKAYGAKNNNNYTGWETSNEYKSLISRRKALNNDVSQFLHDKRRSIMGSPYMFQVGQTSAQKKIPYSKSGSKLTAADRKELQKAKDFNKRLLEDNKQFHKDIMESKREHNKLIMSMSSLTSELIKKAMS